MSSKIAWTAIGLALTVALLAAPAIATPKQVAGGAWYILDDNGQVWAYLLDQDASQFGYPNPDWQGGHLVRIGGLEHIASIDGESLRSLALRSDGTVWSWEPAMVKGQFVYKKARRVQGLSDVVAISAGFDHNLALRTNGTVWGWGDNRAGQVKMASKHFHENLAEVKTPPPVAIASPVQVGIAARVVAIRAGVLVSAAVDDEGHVWTWGFNDGEASCLGKGEVVAGRDKDIAVKVARLPKIVAVTAASRIHALDDQGGVWSWGCAKVQPNPISNAEPIREAFPEPIKAITAAWGYVGGVAQSGRVYLVGTGSPIEALQKRKSSYTAIPIQVPGIDDAVSLSADDFTLSVLRKNGAITLIGGPDNGKDLIPQLAPTAPP